MREIPLAVFRTQTFLRFRPDVGSTRGGQAGPAIILTWDAVAGPYMERMWLIDGTVILITCTDVGVIRDVLDTDIFPPKLLEKIQL